MSNRNDAKDAPFGLSAEVLSLAAEAFYDHLQTITLAIEGPEAPRWNGRIGPSQRGKDNMLAALRAALTVLGPAIQTAIIERMVADAYDEDEHWTKFAVSPGALVDHDGSFDPMARVWENLDIAAALRTYLPKPDGGAR